MSKEKEIKGALRTVFSLPNPVESRKNGVMGFEKRIAGCRSEFELLFSEVFKIPDLEKEIPAEFFEYITNFNILIAKYYEVLSGEQILLLMQTFYALLAEVAFSFPEDEVSHVLGVGFLTKAHESIQTLAMKK